MLENNVYKMLLVLLVKKIQKDYMHFNCYKTFKKFYSLVNKIFYLKIQKSSHLKVSKKKKKDKNNKKTNMTLEFTTFWGGG